MNDVLTPTGVLVPRLEPGSAAWLQRMSASKIAAVVGLSSYQSRFSLWHRMAGLVEQEHGLGSGSNGRGDLFEVVGHRLGGAKGHDQTRADAPGRADRPEDVGRLCALILWG